MSYTTNEKALCAIDIGTSKIVVLLAELKDNEEINIVGISAQPSKGLKKGVIVNIDSTVKAIQKAIKEVRDISGFSITKAYISITGNHIQSFDSHGVAAIENSEVSQNDLKQVINSAKAVPMASNQEILHILYQDFIIDDHDGIKKPIGMFGVRLESRVHIFTGSSTAIKNIKKCVNRCGVEVQGVVLEQLASSYSVLTNDEKEHGVCLIDIGAGTTSVIVIVEGSVKSTFVIPIAGTQITNDIARALHVSTDTAEQIKTQYGYATPGLIGSENSIEISGILNRFNNCVSLENLSSVIEARIEELFAIIYDFLDKNILLNSLSSGFVLTGGVSKMRGIAQLAEEVLKMRVRIGSPKNITNTQDVLHSPIYSAGVGLLMHNQVQFNEDSKMFIGVKSNGVWGQIKDWFSNRCS